MFSDERGGQLDAGWPEGQERNRDAAKKEVVERRWRAGTIAICGPALGLGLVLAARGPSDRSIVNVGAAPLATSSSAPIQTPRGPALPPATGVAQSEAIASPTPNASPIAGPRASSGAPTRIGGSRASPPGQTGASRTARPAAPRTVLGPLRTSSNGIYDGRGNPVTFVGLNRYGLQSDNTTNLTPDDINHAKEWGANFVRVALGEQLWLSNSCSFDSTYSLKVDNVVNWITSRGMVALLDLHSNSITTCGPAGPHEMADSPNSIYFWQQVAARYKSNPLVAFDLYNEPNGISPSVWLNGGQVNQGGVTFQAAGMQQMYDAVRGQGANNLIFASGQDWGETFPPLLSGYNVVYANHSYTCPQEAPPNCSTANPYDPPSGLGTWVSPSQFVPVMVTEFGWPDKNDGRYIANVVAYAENHGWGWAVFAWDGTSSGTFDLLADVGPGQPYDPTTSGMAVVNGLNQNR